MKFRRIMKNDYISLAEAAKGTSYSADYLRLRARQGKLRAKKINGLWYTTVNWLRKYNQLCKKVHTPETNSQQVFFEFLQPLNNISHFLNHVCDLVVYNWSVGLGYFSFVYNKKRKYNRALTAPSIDKYFWHVKIACVFVFAVTAISSNIFFDKPNNYGELFSSYFSEVQLAAKDLSHDFKEQYIAKYKNTPEQNKIMGRTEFTINRSSSIQTTLGRYIANSLLPITKSIKSKLTYLEKKYPVVSYNKNVYKFWDGIFCTYKLDNANYTFQNFRQRYYELVSRIINVPTKSERSLVVGDNIIIDVQPRVLGEVDFRGRLPQVKSVPPLPRVEIIYSSSPKLLN